MQEFKFEFEVCPELKTVANTAVCVSSVKYNSIV